METNNKLREALCEISNLADALDIDNPNVVVILDRCRDALAEPVLNCEVGTPDEQFKRFLKRWEGVGYGEIDERSIRKMSIFSRWAQMPYEEGGDK